MVTLTVKAQLHRAYYVPGDTVKCCFHLLNTDRHESLVDETGRWDDDLRTARLVGTTIADCAPAIRIVSIRLQLLGTSAIDTTRLSEAAFSKTTRFADEAAASGDWILTESLTDSPSSLATAASCAHNFYATPIVEPTSQTVTSALRSSSNNDSNGGASPGGASATRSGSTPVSTESHVLQVSERLSGAVTTKLPQGLPPTHKGQNVRYEYAFHISIVWAVASGDGKEGEKQLTVLRVPVKLYSPAATITVLRSPFATLRLMNDPSATQAVLMPTQSSPAFASPLSDALMTKDAVSAALINDPGRHYVAEAAKAQLQRLSSPSEYLIRHHQVPVTTLFLSAHAATLGSSILGTFTQVPNSDWVCGRVTAGMEMYERVPKKLFHKNAIIPKRTNTHLGASPSHGRTEGSFSTYSIDWMDHAPEGLAVSREDPEEELIVSHSKVVEELEWFTGQAVEMPFTLSFTPAKYCCSFHTESVSVTWMLRLRFYCCKATEWSGFQKSGRSKTVEFHIEQLELPITIFAPAGGELESLSANAGESVQCSMGAPIYLTS